MARWACPSADAPWSTTAVTVGTERMACSTRSMAASASVSVPTRGGAGCRRAGRGRRGRRARATKVTVDVVRGLNGAASWSARTLAAVDGRNWELLDFSTLEREGRQVIRQDGDHDPAGDDGPAEPYGEPS